MLKLDQVVPTNTGTNAGPTTQGMTNRCGSLKPTDSIVSFGGMGQISLLQPTSCQLVVLPIVEDANTQAAAWPKQGGADVRVIGFSWWVISDVYDHGSRVDAVYVGPAETDPSAGSSLPPAYSTQLTG